MLKHLFDTKADARTWGLRIRKAMPATERAVISARITDRLVTMPLFAEAETLLSYVGSKEGELDTIPIIVHAIAMGKPVLVPITRAGGVLVWSQLTRVADLALTPRGILEPNTVKEIVPHGGLCVTPGVCFRRDGHRIGFGAGYYDRFLEHFSGVSIALSPEALVGVEFPVDPHDRPVSAIVTEETVYPTGPDLLS